MTGNGFILGPIRAMPDALLIGYTATRAAVPIAQGTERRLLHVPLSGGPSTLLDAVVGDNGIGDIHVESDDAYWWDDAGAYRTTLSTVVTAVLTEGHPPPDGYVYRSYVALGGAVYYATTHATSTILPGSVGRLGDSGPLATGMALDGGIIAWSDAHSVYTLPVTGGTPREIAFKPSLTGPVAVSGGWVYWTDQIEIERAHADGTETQMLVNFPTYGGPNSIFATPSSVVWTDSTFQAVLGAVASQ